MNKIHSPIAVIGATREGLRRWRGYIYFLGRHEEKTGQVKIHHDSHWRSKRLDAINFMRPTMPGQVRFIIFEG